MSRWVCAVRGCSRTSRSRLAGLGNVNNHKKEIKKFFNWDVDYQNQFKNFSTFLHKTKLSGIEERSKTSKVVHEGLKVQIEKLGRSLKGPLKGPGIISRGLRKPKFTRF